MSDTVRFVLHSLLVIAAMGYFARTIYGRLRVLQSVRWTALFDRLPERINALLVYGFGQKKFLIDERERSAGWMHFFIFWGFTILGVAGRRRRSARAGSARTSTCRSSASTCSAVPTCS